jgi:hypothetical protein
MCMGHTYVYGAYICVWGIHMCMGHTYVYAAYICMFMHMCEAVSEALTACVRTTTRGRSFSRFRVEIQIDGSLVCLSAAQSSS